MTFIPVPVGRGIDGGRLRFEPKVKCFVMKSEDDAFRLIKTAFSKMYADKHDPYFDDKGWLRDTVTSSKANGKKKGDDWKWDVKIEKFKLDVLLLIRCFNQTTDEPNAPEIMLVHHLMQDQKQENESRQDT
jgi:hypothetical protein